jgi:NAD-dependent DNA ligase
MPTSAEGIEKYLSSGMIRAVGPVYAKKLVRAFGEKVFDVIEVTPDRLREVDGIGPIRAASILGIAGIGDHGTASATWLHQTRNATNESEPLACRGNISRGVGPTRVVNTKKARPRRRPDQVLGGSMAIEHRNR